MIAGDRVPAGIGEATVLATLDGETYSYAGLLWNGVKWGSLPGLSDQTRGLRAVGARVYVEHPSFELLWLAFDLKQGAGPVRWTPPADLRPLPLNLAYFDPLEADPRHPFELLSHVSSGQLLEAHNSGFEWTWWNFYAVPRWGWPPLKLEQLRCSMAKSRASSYPGKLAEVGDVLNIEHKKDPEGEKLIKLLSMPCNPTKKYPYTRRDSQSHPAEFARFGAYCERDVLAESEVSERVADLNNFELSVWQLDQRINLTRGLPMDRKGIDDCIVIIEQVIERGNAELRKITNGEVNAYTEAAKLQQWLYRAGLMVHSVDEESVTEALERFPPGTTDPRARALRIRQELSFSSVKKLYAMRAQLASDDRLYDQWAYHGTHTGLWNGQGVQVANLYKAEDKLFNKPVNVERALELIACGSMELIEFEYGAGRALEIVASCLRSMVKAPPGFDIIGTDLTAIQAVVLAFLSGEQWRMDVFNGHGKIYETSIAKMSGVSLEEILNYRKTHGTHHPLRQNGKVAELSGGFGGWVNAWRKEFKKAGIIVTDDQIKQMILAWRAESPMIVEFWGGQSRGRFSNAYKEYFGLEGAAIQAVLNPGQCFAHRDTRYQMHGDALYCMPIGDCGVITYHSPRLQPSQRDYAQPWELELSYMGNNTNATKGAPGWQRMKLYGGLLTQNVVSRVARNIQAYGLLRLDARGYPLIFHNHDESAALVPEGWGSQDEYDALLSERPWWAATWPIKTGGAWREKRYGKWD